MSSFDGTDPDVEAGADSEYEYQVPEYTYPNGLFWSDKYGYTGVDFSHGYYTSNKDYHFVKTSEDVSSFELGEFVDGEIDKVTVPYYAGLTGRPFPYIIDDGADWYTIDPMSGRNNKVLSITVKALGDAEQRTSSFTITSDKGNVQLKVRVSQNTDEPAELRSIENMVFGVATFTHWNVDYFGEVIEETYKRYEFNPNDTSVGYQMYFLEDSIGIQKDNHSDSTVFYQFKYFYDPDARIIHLDFVVEGDTTEIYDAPVLVATEELFRFQHEYKPMRWELADMRKIGTILPQEKTRITKAIKKRKPTGGVFQF
jgi:hypothetical protein